MTASYLATEFQGDPPVPVARWYKVQAGTYARFSDRGISFFHPADLGVEQSVGTAIEYVANDGSVAEIAAVDAAWRNRGTAD